jgi:hypothetical protein
MLRPDSGSFHTVTEPEQARLLTEPTSKEYFKPFLAQERSAAEAATVANCSLNTMLYRIKTFLQAGLLEVVRVVPRKGRAVKIYRSVHDAYFIPFKATPYATLEEGLEAHAAPIFAELLQAYAAALRARAYYGHHLFVDEGGVVWTSDLLPELTPSDRPVVFSDVRIRLRDEDARVLGRDLRELFDRALHLDAQAHGDPAAKRYLLLVGLMPDDEQH